jgi:hypothetical protein
MPTQTKFAAHIAIIVKPQSDPPIMIPFTGYARPLNTCVRRTAGKIAADADCTAWLVVSPLNIESLWRYVVNDKAVATNPPIHIEVLIRCLTSFARTESECVVVSANSRLSNSRMMVSLNVLVKRHYGLTSCLRSMKTAYYLRKHRLDSNSYCFAYLCRREAQLKCKVVPDGCGCSKENS